MHRSSIVVVVVGALLALGGCKKSEPEEAAPAAPGPLAITDHAAERAAAEEEAESTEVGSAAVHGADALLAQGQQGAALAVPVDEALVQKYLGYRQQVVHKGRNAVAKFQKDLAVQKASAKEQASAVKAVRAAEDFGERMRQVEEQARVEAGLSRDEVGAVALVVGAVLSERQLWKMSGGDEAIAQARARIEEMPPEQKARAQAALDASAPGYAQAKAAGLARQRFGDAAVDAVLAHEEALWTLQKEGMGVMAQVN